MLAYAKHNVTKWLPKVVAARIKSVMHVAYQLPEKECGDMP